MRNPEELKAGMKKDETRLNFDEREKL